MLSRERIKVHTSLSFSFIRAVYNGAFSIQQWLARKVKNNVIWGVFRPCRIKKSTCSMFDSTILFKFTDALRIRKCLAKSKSMRMYIF